jgi:hypothetical protein
MPIPPAAIFIAVVLPSGDRWMESYPGLTQCGTDWQSVIRFDCICRSPYTISARDPSGEYRFLSMPPSPLVKSGSKWQCSGHVLCHRHTPETDKPFVANRKVPNSYVVDTDTAAWHRQWQ